jgi:hypothetical protein
MVAELAIFAAIGTTAGLITFLTVTAETLYNKAHDASSITDRLNHWRSRMLVADQGLRNWRAIWYDKDGRPRSDPVYQLSWGKNGHRTIQLMLRGIGNVSVEIERILNGSWKRCLRSQAPPLRDWRQALESRLYSDGAPQSRDANVVQKTCLALYQGSHLENSINRLRNKGGIVENYAKQEHLQRLGKDDLSQKIFSRDLHTTDIVNTNLETLTKTMDEMYQRDQGDDIWVLVLGKPTFKDGLQILRHSSNLGVEFLVDRKKECRLVEIDSRCSAGPSGPCWESGQHVQFEGTDCDINLTGLLEETKVDRMLRLEMRPAFATIAMKLTNNILLFKSRWTRDLCICGIRIVDNFICTFQAGCLSQDIHTLLRLSYILLQLGIGENGGGLCASPYQMNGERTLSGDLELVRRGTGVS